MNLATTKVELASQLLNTNNKELISHIKAIFDTQEDSWWNCLPDKIKASVERALKQSATGDTIPHSEVMKKYKKWLKK